MQDFDDSELRDRLCSGAAWDEFCETLRAAGKTVLRGSAPASALDRAEGYRYLSRLTRLSFRMILEHGDPAYPRLIQAADDTLKVGIDNPDNLYQWARISAEHGYRLSGSRGSVRYLGIGIYAGSFGGGGRRTVAHLNANDLVLDAEGRFELFLGGDPDASPRVPLDPDTNTLMIRQTFADRGSERPAELRIERIGADGPPPPLAAAAVARALRGAGRYVAGSARLFADLSDEWQSSPNRFIPSDPTKSRETFGDPDLYYMGGYWRLTPEQALLIEFLPPPCLYWGFVLCNYWMESLDYRYHPVHTNDHLAPVAPDGSVRIVVADRDPALPDSVWIDTAGHREGTMCLRWLMAEATPVPQPRVVDWQTLAGSRPR